MLWLGLTCSAVYFSIAVYSDVYSVYSKLRDLKFYLTPTGFPSFESIRASVKRYRSSVIETVANLAAIPFLTYPLQRVYSYHQAPIHHDLFHVFVAATVSGILYRCWERVYPRRETKYTIETGNLLWFTGLLSTIQFPFFFFQVREAVLWPYALMITGFLALNNIPVQYKDEKRLPSLLAKRPITAFLKRARTRQGRV